MDNNEYKLTVENEGFKRAVVEAPDGGRMVLERAHDCRDILQLIELDSGGDAVSCVFLTKEEWRLLASVKGI